MRAPRLLAASAALLTCAAQSSQAPASSYNLLVGFGGNQSIQVFRLDGRAEGRLVQVGEAAALPDSSWMTADPTNSFLFVSTSANGGGVTVMNLNATDAGVALTRNASYTQWGGGGTPTSLAYVDFPGGGASGAFLPSGGAALYSVSYTAGSFTTWSFWPGNGTLIPAFINAACANAHQVLPVPISRYAPQVAFALVIPCLGENTINLNGVGAGCGGTLGAVCYLGGDGYSRAGSGPRHAVPHPSLPLLYVINEKDNSLATWKLDVGLNPQLSSPVYTSSLPPGYNNSGSQWAGAEIAIHPNGRWLYASNRALPAAVLPSGATMRDNIGLWSIDAGTGALTPRGWYDGDGTVNFPRHFSISPDGQWAVVANQGGASLTLLSVNSADGSLAYVMTVSTGVDNRGAPSAPTFAMFVGNTHTAPPPRVANGAAGGRADGGAALLAAAVCVAAAAALGRGETEGRG